MTVRCGNREAHDLPARHDTVAQVRECYEYTRMMQEEGHLQQQAELEAERRNERYFEEGPESFQAARWAEEQEELQRIGRVDIGVDPDPRHPVEREMDAMVQAAEREEDERVALYKHARDTIGLPHPALPGVTHQSIMWAEYDAAAAADGLALLDADFGPDAQLEALEEASSDVDDAPAEDPDPRKTRHFNGECECDPCGVRCSYYSWQYQVEHGRAENE